MSEDVAIFDDLTVLAAHADRWLTEWRANYLPAAERRGLRLEGVWRGATRDPDRVNLVVHWTLPSVDAFWAARGQAAADPTVARFWQATDAIVVARDRRVLAREGKQP